MKTRGTTSQTRVLSFLVLVFVSAMAIAETVLIQSEGGRKGQGWLFGSPIDASCWVATPRHVILVGGEPANFLWTDLHGRQGEAHDPIEPRPGLDLVFARTIGRESGICLSRLGRDDLTSLINRQPRAWLQTRLATHLRPLPMQMSDAGQEMVRFEPLTEEGENYLREGISGSPLLYRQEMDEADLPLALALKVPKGQTHGHALRFDVVKAEFHTAMRQAGNRGADAPPDGSAAFSLSEATGRSRSPSTSPTQALTESGCWIARPPEGDRQHSLVIVPKDPEARFIHLTATYRDGCDAPPDQMLVQAPVGSGWRTIATCTASAGVSRCLLANRRAPRLRIVLIRRDGTETAVARLALIQGS